MLEVPQLRKSKYVKNEVMQAQVHTFLLIISGGMDPMNTRIPNFSASLRSLVFGHS